MFECLILGDSIAVGTSHVLPNCISFSKGGINTWQWNKMYGNERKEFASEVVIISLGTNDHKGVKTFDELVKMRNKVNAKRIYWIMPPCNESFCKPNVNDWVKQIASKNGDFIIGTQRLQKDNIHPSTAGYKEIASQVR